MARSVCSDTATPTSSAGRRSDKVRTVSGWLTLWFVVTALAIRLTVKDSIPWLAVIYYAAPWPILAIGFLTTALLLRRSLSRRLKQLLVAFSLLCITAFYSFHYHHSPVKRTIDDARPVADGDNELRVAFWNVARGIQGWEPVFSEVRKTNADIFGMVECAPLSGKLRVRLEREFPDYHVTFFTNGMVLLSRLPITKQQDQWQFRGARFGIATATFNKEPVHVVVADIASRLSLFRKAPLEELHRISVELSHQPTIVMGDFNTPSDSVFLHALRTEFSSAFEETGEGFHCTWPVPCPVMAIDHLWVNSAWQIIDCQLGWTWCSDHRPIVSTLEFRAPNKL